jgi:hypothetical protein
MVPSFVDDDPTLLACCLVSRTFLRIAKPRLYASLHIYIQSDTPGSGYYSMPPPTHPLFMRLSAEPDLGALVQQITFLVEFVGDEEEPGPSSCSNIRKTAASTRPSTPSFATSSTLVPSISTPRAQSTSSRS